MSVRLKISAPLAIAAVLFPTPATADNANPTVPESETWRAQRPAVAAPRPPVLPTFEKTVLPNGMTLYIAVEKALPLVSFRVVLKGGSTQDPKDKPGLTNLTFGMLDEGAGDLDALAFSDRVADLGASFGGGASRDQGGVGISGLTRNAEPMLALLADAVLRPRMAAEDFDRLKEKTLADLTRRRGSPPGLAGEYIPSLIYGDTHPYGHPVEGSIETVRTLTLDDVKAQYTRLFTPRHAALIAIGDISLERAKVLAKKAFGAWKNKGEALKPVPAVEASARRRIMLVNKAPAPQTFALVGRPLFGRGHPDEMPVRLANAVFGGAFAARLNMNLREDKGYTYGANSTATFREGVGVLLAYAALRQDVTVEGLKEFFGELDGMASRPPTKEEVSDAKDGRVRSLTGQFQGIGATAGAASALFAYDLPLDYFAKLPNRYGETSLDAVQAAGKKYFKEPLMQVLLVGDASVVLPKLKAAGLGPVEVVEPPSVGP